MSRAEEKFRYWQAVSDPEPVEAGGRLFQGELEKQMEKAFVAGYKMGIEDQLGALIQDILRRGEESSS